MFSARLAAVNGIRALTRCPPVNLGSFRVNAFAIIYTCNFRAFLYSSGSSLSRLHFALRNDLNFPVQDLNGLTNWNLFDLICMMGSQCTGLWTVRAKS